MSRQNNDDREPVKTLLCVYRVDGCNIKKEYPLSNGDDKVDIITSQDDESAPDFYNRIIRDGIADIYGFIDTNCHLDKNCVNEVVSKFRWSTDQIFGACYTDYILINSGIRSSQYYTSYNINSLKNCIINPYFFANGQIATEIFNKNLDTLYYYEALLKIGMNAMIYHIPKPLMEIQHFPQDIQSDIRKLNINVRV